MSIIRQVICSKNNSIVFIEDEGCAFYANFAPSTQAYVNELMLKYPIITLLVNYSCNTCAR